MTCESNEMVTPKNGIASPSFDDDNNGGNVGPNSPLKKGPWTSAEDAILVEYVTKHGEGNWNAVQKHSGLARCGKSCRLRWANHLRPDLKKGAFSEEEENLIIELHAKMGNKWARMAAELPGRTDNEIKNFWNTRIKRKQRAGLPIYPPEICLQALNDNQNIDDTPTFSTNDAHYPDFVPVNSFEIPAVEFKNLEMNQQLYPPPLLDIPSSSLLEQGFQSSYPNKPLLSTTHHHHPSKRLRGSSSYFSNLDAIQFQNDSSLQIAQTFMYPSSSEPNWEMKLELPSLQTPSSPLPSLESVDTLIQTPPNENAMSCNPSPRNSGLLEAVLYESQNMKCSKKTYTMDNLHETGWEAYGEPLSPIGHSSSSVFSESTPISGNSFDEPESIETITGCKVKEPNTFVPMHYDHKIEKTNPMMYMSPDFWLASDCFGPKNDHSLLKDAIGTLGGDDLSRDCKQMDTSCAWNAMSTV